MFKHLWEKIFYLINHCISHRLNVLVTSDIDLYEYNFNLPDLLSRLKIFNYVSINKPDDEILINVLTKLLMEKQFIIKNKKSKELIYEEDMDKEELDFIDENINKDE